VSLLQKHFGCSIRSRYIGLAHTFEYYRGEDYPTWSFTVMHMPRGMYTVVLIRDWREVYTLEYRDLLLDARPTPYRRPAALEEIPGDVLREVERALCAIHRSSVEDRVRSLSDDARKEVDR